MPLRFIALLAAATAAIAHAAAPAEPAVKPGYIGRDGKIAVIGNDGMDKLLPSIGAIAARSQPGVRYTMTLKGSSTGLPALAADATLFAPLAREAWRGELAGFKQIHGYEATAIQIGYSGWGPRASGKTPPAVYVSRSNPLAAISVHDLARVFSAGSRQGDINLWSQLGVTGEAGARRVHIYGVRDDGGFATAFRDRYFGKRPYALRYEPLASYAEVLCAVAADPFGMGVVGWVDPAAAGDAVRILPVSTGNGAAETPDRKTVAAGAYPLSSGLYFYVDKAPGKPLDPLVRAWLEAALSDEGQAVIASQADSADATPRLR